MKNRSLIVLFVSLFMAACVSLERRRDEERGYVRASNEKFERLDGGGTTKVVGVAKEMGVRASALFPEVDAAFENAKKEGRKITIPRLLSAPPPSYPLLAQLLPTEGEVWVAFVVAEDGSVADARALTDADTSFGEAAVKAVRKWRFIPGHIDDVRSRFLLTVPVRFELPKRG